MKKKFLKAQLQLISSTAVCLLLANRSIQWSSVKPASNYEEPQIIEYIPVNYPPEAIERKIEGYVVALIYIDFRGYVRAVEFEKTAHPILNRAVYTAVKDWRFSPALLEGRPVRTTITRTFPFHPKPPIRN